MVGNPFTYPAWDLTTMTQLDSLPYAGVTFGEALNQPGPWQGSLLLTDPRIRTLSYLDSSRTGRTLLCVDLAGVLVWGGIIWTRRYQKSTKLMQVGAQEIGSYFQQRLQANDYTATWNGGADPMLIAQTVIADAQAMAGGSIAGGVTLTLNPATGSGQSVSASYPGTQLQTVDQIVSTLAQMGYTLGFDYSFDVAYLPGTRTPGVTMNIWYPRQGRSADRSGIVLLSQDTIDWTYDEDSTKQATTIWETGSGTGNLQPIEASATLPGYPLLEQTFSRSDVNTESILANVALNDLGLSCYPITTPTIAIPVPVPDAQGRPDPTRLGFGDFGLGDDLLFRVDPVAGGGLNTDPRFPNGLYFEWRINNWTCTVADKGVSTILFDLGVPPVNTIPPPQPPL